MLFLLSVSDFSWSANCMSCTQSTPPRPTWQNCLVLSHYVGQCGLSRWNSERLRVQISCPIHTADAVMTNFYWVRSGSMKIFSFWFLYLFISALWCAHTIHAPTFYCLSNALDGFSSQFLHMPVRISPDRSFVERLSSQFFTDFHQILHVSWKCGRFDAYCLWDKPEVDFWL